MARAKKSATKAAVTVSTPEASTSTLPIVPVHELKQVEAVVVPAVAVSPPRDEIKVNNSSATELKHACDDALKRHLSLPDRFRPIHLHTDVRLALGWAAVVISLATGLYGYKTEFETSKPIVWAGLILYMILSTIQTAYAYFIEGSIVFVGKRKSFSKRIVTERLTVSSSTIPITKSTTCPSYALSLAYVQSASKGKTLIAKGKVSASKEYAAFFGAKGVMDQEGFEKWVDSLVASVMESRSQ